MLKGIKLSHQAVLSAAFRRYRQHLEFGLTHAKQNVLFPISDEIAEEIRKIMPISQNSIKLV